MSAENKSSPGSNGWEQLTPNSDLLVDRSVIIPDPSSDIYNPATFRHPTCNSQTGAQGSIFASEIIDARLQYREDRFPKPAKPSPVRWQYQN